MRRGRLAGAVEGEGRRGWGRSIAIPNVLFSEALILTFLVTS